MPTEGRASGPRRPVISFSLSSIITGTRVSRRLNAGYMGNRGSIPYQPCNRQIPTGPPPGRPDEKKGKTAMDTAVSTTGTTRKTDPDWNEFREQMPVARRWAYLDHACVAPLPRAAGEAIARWAREAQEEGDVVWKDWEAQHEQLRVLAAELTGAEPAEIALIPNTTFGINLVAGGLEWREGDNVVLPDHEFPSNLYPWMALEAQGVELRVVSLEGNRVDANRVADACDDRTRVVSASWVGYASGYRIDPAELAEVAHRHGAYFFLDAIQGLGVFPLDVQAAGVDFYAADGHKWLLGPEGAGIFYCRRELLAELRPMNVGWNSVKQGNDFSHVALDVRDEARRYEGGTQNMAGFIGLNASLQLLARFGLAHDRSLIAERVVAFADQVCETLERAGGAVYSDRADETKSGIVSFEMPGWEAREVKKQLLSRGVVLSERGGRLRISAHAYNDASDLDRLADALDSLRG